MSSRVDAIADLGTRIIFALDMLKILLYSYGNWIFFYFKAKAIQYIPSSFMNDERWRMCSRVNIEQIVMTITNVEKKKQHFNALLEKIKIKRRKNSSPKLKKKPYLTLECNVKMLPNMLFTFKAIYHNFKLSLFTLLNIVADGASLDTHTHTHTSTDCHTMHEISHTVLFSFVLHFNAIRVNKSAPVCENQIPNWYLNFCKNVYKCDWVRCSNGKYV